MRAAHAGKVILLARKLALNRFNTATAQYAGIQSTYWMAACAISGFITVFLLEYGVSISQVGFVIAAINTLSIVVQMGVASVVSRRGKLTLKLAVLIMSAAASAASFALLFCLGRGTPVLLALLMPACIITTAMQPLITSIAMEFVNRGYFLDFSAARGVGSLAYAGASYVLGVLIAKHGSGFLPAVHIGFAAIMVIIVVMLKVPSAPAPGAVHVEELPEQSGGVGLATFIKKHGQFLVMLLGVASVSLCTRMVSTYLIKIIESIGGNSSHMGTAVAFSAISEFPIMLNFSKLNAKFGCGKLMKVGAVFYTIRSAAIIFSSQIWMLYGAHFLQMFAFALMLPALTYYINDIMDDRDRIKGQSMGVAAMAIGDVLGALLCGVLPTSLGVRGVLLIGLVISAVGSVTVLLSARSAAKPAGQS